MKKEEEIIRLMQERLQEAEAPVDASVWEAVLQQLPSAPAGGASGSTGFSGLTATAKWAIGLLTAVIPAAAIVYFVATGDDDAAKAADATVIMEPEAIPSENDASTSGVLSPEKEPGKKPEPSSEPEEAQSDHPNSAAIAEPSRERVQAINSDPVADTITIERVEEQSGSPLIRGAEEPEVSPSHDPSVQHSSTGTSAPEDEREEALPEPTISVETEDRESLIYRFSASAPGDEGYNYSWLIDGEVIADGAQVYHQFDREGVYELQLRAYRNGTKEKELNRELEVYLPARLELPNVFTPNGDGVNDRLTLGNGSRKVVIEQMIVYDSNGREVFSQYGEGPGWNGADISGNELPEGNYILVLRAVSERGQPFNERQVVRLER